MRMYLRRCTSISRLGDGLSVSVFLFCFVVSVKFVEKERHIYVLVVYVLPCSLRALLGSVQVSSLVYVLG